MSDPVDVESQAKSLQPKSEKLALGGMMKCCCRLSEMIGAVLATVAVFACSILPGVLMLWWLMPLTMIRDEANGQLYIGALSAGCIVWGILLGTMGLQCPVIALDMWSNPDPLDLGHYKEKWEKHFSNQPTGGRIFGGCQVLLRACANGSALIYSAWVLPPRDPSKNLNLSKYLLAWLEAPLAGLLALACIFWLLVICLVPDTSVAYVKFAKNVRRLSRFSALSSLPYANPAVLWSQLQGAVFDYLQVLEKLAEQQDPGAPKKSQRPPTNKEELMKHLSGLSWFHLLGLGYVVFSQMVYILLFACAAIGSVVVKTSQVSFVSDKPWHDWTGAELIQLASFINALSGLGLDPNLLGLVKVLRERYEDTQHYKNEELVDSWQQQVMECIMEGKGPASLMICGLTLDLNDCCAFSKSRLRYLPQMRMLRRPFKALREKMRKPKETE